MFYGLKWISKSEQYEKYEKFTSLCKEWLNKNYSPDDFVGESWHIKRILPTINDAVVLYITEDRSDEFYFCRAKHGDFNAIIKSLQMDFFLPSVYFKEWEGIINYALKMHKKQLASSLISYLSSDLLSHPCFFHLLRWQVGSLPLAPPGKPSKRGPPTRVKIFKL